ncbi:MAG: hypothetical protein AAF387_09890 [Pseudomonadota bacterium]
MQSSLVFERVLILLPAFCFAHGAIALVGDVEMQMSVAGDQIRVQNIGQKLGLQLVTIEIEGNEIDWIANPSTYISDVIVETNTSVDGFQSEISFDSRSFQYGIMDY